MSRIAHITEMARERGRKLLIPYLVVGDPTLQVTVDLMHSLVESGADVIELGIPFSDPSSDGPVIQRSIERSLGNGTSLRDSFNVVAEFRKSDQVTPIVLMGYLNPVEIMGADAFVKQSLKVGVDGVLLVDMPPAEAETIHKKLTEAEIDTIFLVAPTTSEDRVKSIVELTSGYVYYVSLKGVTGASISDTQSVQRNVDAVRKMTDLPVVVGFGVKDEQSAKNMSGVSDGVIVGTALVENIESLDCSTEVNYQDIAKCTSIIKNIRNQLDSEFNDTRKESE